MMSWLIIWQSKFRRTVFCSLVCLPASSLSPSVHVILMERAPNVCPRTLVPFPSPFARCTRAERSGQLVGAGAPSWARGPTHLLFLALSGCHRSGSIVPHARVRLIWLICILFWMSKHLNQFLSKNNLKTTPWLLKTHPSSAGYFGPVKGQLDGCVFLSFPWAPLLPHA